MNSPASDSCCVFDLNEYHINSDTGFMLKDPLRTLPTYFNPWNDLATSLPTLVKEKTFRQAVHKLPLLDHDKLIGHRQLRLAHLQLSLISSGYVWQNGEAGVVTVLPKCVAIPYCKISEQLAIKPIVSLTDVVLANYAFIDPDRNLECLYHLPEQTTGDWFCKVIQMTELNFAGCLKPITRILELLASKKPTSQVKDIQDNTRENEIMACLEVVCRCTKNMKSSMSRMREQLDARSFFNAIRPFFDGWGGEKSPLPDGLIYEGVFDSPVKLIGGSGAQSPTLQVLDSLLGVEHSADKRHFFLEMRNYMLPIHKRFVEDIELNPYQLREFVISSSNETLKSKYNRCLSALKEMRDYHTQLVKMYIIIPSRKASECVNTNLNQRGTGGTNPIPFLVDICSATAAKLLHVEEPATKMQESGWTVLSSTFRLCLTAIFIAAVGVYTTSLI